MYQHGATVLSICAASPFTVMQGGACKETDPSCGKVFMLQASSFKHYSSYDVSSSLQICLPAAGRMVRQRATLRRTNYVEAEKGERCNTKKPEDSVQAQEEQVEEWSCRWANEDVDNNLHQPADRQHQPKHAKQQLDVKADDRQGPHVVWIFTLQRTQCLEWLLVNGKLAARHDWASALSDCCDYKHRLFHSRAHDAAVPANLHSCCNRLNLCLLDYASDALQLTACR